MMTLICITNNWRKCVNLWLEEKNSLGFPSWEVVVDLETVLLLTQSPAEVVEVSCKVHRSLWMKMSLKHPSEEITMLLPFGSVGKFGPWLLASVRASGCDYNRDVYVPLVFCQWEHCIVFSRASVQCRCGKTLFKGPGCGTCFLPFGNLHHHKRPQQPDLFRCCTSWVISLI